MSDTLAGRLAPASRFATGRASKFPDRRIGTVWISGRIMPPAKANANAPDDDADNRRPEREEEQQARTDRIRVGIGPQPNGGRDDDKYERARTDEKQAETEFDQRGSKIWSHATCVRSCRVKHLNRAASPMRGERSSAFGGPLERMVERLAHEYTRATWIDAFSR